MWGLKQQHPNPCWPGSFLHMEIDRNSTSRVCSCHVTGVIIQDECGIRPKKKKKIYVEFPKRIFVVSLSHNLRVGQPYI